MTSVNHLTWWTLLQKTDSAQSTTIDLLHFFLARIKFLIFAGLDQLKLSIKVQFWKSSV